MATTMTLAELRTAIRQRSDMQNQSGDYTNAFIPDTELNSYINQSYFELYDLLVTAYGEDYYIAPFFTFVTDGTTQLYDLPDDFYKMLNVSVQVTSNAANNAWWTLKPFMMAEVNKYAVPNTQLYFGITNLRYRIQGDQIWLNPLPQINQTIRLIYTPKMTTLTSDSDTVQGVSGWTEYIIIDAAIKCLQKEESDVSVLMAQKMAMMKRIDGVSSNRDAGMPHTVADSQASNSFFPWGSGGGFGGY
jgi:hypothetical protein